MMTAEEWRSSVQGTPDIRTRSSLECRQETDGLHGRPQDAPPIRCLRHDLTPRLDMRGDPDRGNH
jgi:hypothetical protein